jgi:hypothetical protein
MADADAVQALVQDAPEGEAKKPDPPPCEQCGEPKIKGHVHLKLLKPKTQMPQTRGDCLDGGSNAARPCGWLTCRWWLYSQNPETWGPLCILDVADEGGTTLEKVGEMMGITRERIRQIESKFLKNLRTRDANAQGKLRAILDDVNSLDRG